MMCRVFIFLVLWATSLQSGEVPTVQEARISLDHTDHVFTPVTVRFKNDLLLAYDVCWVASAPLPDAPLTHPCSGVASCICTEIAAGRFHDMHTTAESLWTVSLPGSRDVLGRIFVFGGKHVFSLSKHMFETKTVLLTRGTVQVHSPDDCTSQTGYDVLGPLWKDAVRVAAHRLNYSLCLCGDYNASSTYTLQHPNPELAEVVEGGSCGCGNGVRNDAVPVVRGEDGLAAAYGHLGVYTTMPNESNRPLFHVFMPCSYTLICAQQFQLAMNCRPGRDRLLDFFKLGGEDYSDLSTEELSKRYFSSVRVNMLHATVESDRLTLKNKLWSTLNNFYGTRVAGLIMPPSFHWEDMSERRQLHELCIEIVGKPEANNRHVFIMKDPNAHRQKGIQLASANDILTGKTFTQGAFTMATSFLASPFLVNGYKINLRRYLVAVCVRGRLRGYVHDDGKNIYTKLKYREPWDGDDWLGDTSGSMLTRRLEEMITTGYVPASHFDDKPLSGLEFAEWVQHRYSRKNVSDGATRTRWGGAPDGHSGQVVEPLFASMHARLALALHASRRDEMFDLCSTHGGSAASKQRRKARIEALLSKMDMGEDEPSSDDELADFLLNDGLQVDEEGSVTTQGFIAGLGDGQVDPTGEKRGYNVPKCIEPSVRYMHFGCDFHIDAPLTGFESRLFECNKGPDMSAHSYRDGKMKREVAADIMTFMGFEGEFDGSADHARKNRMTLVYDSDAFDARDTVLWLANLKQAPPATSTEHLTDSFKSEL